MAVAAPLFLRDIVEFDRSTLHHEVVPVVRAPESGAGWREEYIGKRAASFASASEALALGYSVLVLDDVATAAECEALRREASGLAEAQRAAALAKGALPKDPERCRLPVLDHLGASGLATYDAVLSRTCGAIARALPEFMDTLFGDCLDGETCLKNDRLKFSPGEPAINVYRPGGSFRAHEDGESLSVVMPLNGAESFRGGGTAFWGPGQDYPTYGGSGPNPVLRGPPPAFELTPKAGTAFLFVGSVTHSAHPVVAGERCVFVCSFSPAGRSWRTSQRLNAERAATERAPS